MRLLCGRSALLAAVLLAAIARADELADLVAPGAKPERIAGQREAGAPAWSPRGFLLFVDGATDRFVQRNAERRERVLGKSGRACGLAFDGAGNLYFTQVDRVRLFLPASRRIVRVQDGRFLPVEAPATPHDLALDGDGGVYFTAGAPRPRGVHYLDAGGDTRAVIEDLAGPECLAVAPDGRVLYVGTPRGRAIHRYAIDGPGRPRDGRALFVGESDGPRDLAIDERGNLYASYGDVIVIDPDGRRIGRLPVPGKPAGCAFGGKTLYVATDAGVFALPMRVGGAPPRAPPDFRRDVKAGALTLRVPMHWRTREPAADKRFSQFRLRRAWRWAKRKERLYLQIPEEPGDRAPAELVVYYFGEDGAGKDEWVVERWKEQFAKRRPPDVLEDAKVSVAAHGKCTLVDATGTGYWNQGTPIRIEVVFMKGLRMLAAIVPTEEGPYYVKLTGPERTVTAAERDFLAALGW